MSSVTNYPGTLPDPRTQGASDLTTNMQAFIVWFAANAPAVAGEIATHVGLLNISEYSAGTTYSKFECCYSPEGNTYRFIGDTPTSGDNPVANLNGNWISLTYSNPSVPATANLTGGIVGFDYSRASSSTVDVTAGTCRDSSDQFWIECNAQTVTIGTSGTMFTYLFACSDGVVREDITAAGTNLIAYVNRFIGMVPVETNVLDFHQIGDYVHMIDLYSGASGFSSSSFAAGYTSLPESRIELIQWAIKNTTSGAHVTASYDGTNVAFVVGTGVGTVAATHVDIYGDSNRQVCGLMPHSEDMQFAVDTGTASVTVKQIKMKR